MIYGAGGGIGGAVARAFAREGANLFLSGRHLAKVEQVAREPSFGLNPAPALRFQKTLSGAVEKGHCRAS